MLITVKTTHNINHYCHLSIYTFHHALQYGISKLPATAPFHKIDQHPRWNWGREELLWQLPRTKLFTQLSCRPCVLDPIDMPWHDVSWIDSLPAIAAKYKQKDFKHQLDLLIIYLSPCLAIQYLKPACHCAFPQDRSTSQMELREGGVAVATPEDEAFHSTLMSPMYPRSNWHAMTWRVVNRFTSGHSS